MGLDNIKLAVFVGDGAGEGALSRVVLVVGRETATLAPPEAVKLAERLIEAASKAANNE